MAKRLSRDPKFSMDVKRQYDYACAVCTTQLGIVEAAHIIPASEPRGLDQLWNGIALCPNHHSLFDSRLFVIDPDLIVHIDQQRIDFLAESNRASGMNNLIPYADRAVHPPTFWKKNAALRAQMQDALLWVLEKAGMA
jgi:putative restriction endonuclease